MHSWRYNILRRDLKVRCLFLEILIEEINKISSKNNAKLTHVKRRFLSKLTA